MINIFDKETARIRLLSCGWLARQSQSLQDALLDHVQIQCYETGSFTHHIGDGLGGIFGILDGSFGVMGMNPTEGVLLGHIFRTGAWFGEGPLVRRGPRLLAFRAMETSHVAHIPLGVLDRLMHSLPQALPGIMVMVAENSEVATRTISDLLIRRADRRIASVLLRVTDMSDVPADLRHSDFAITQADLAEMANASRHTVNSTLKRFEAERWLSVGYGRIAIRNRKALRGYLLAEA